MRTIVAIVVVTARCGLGWMEDGMEDVFKDYLPASDFTGHYSCDF